MCEIRRREYIFILIVFVVSRLAYFWNGIRFDASPLRIYWQLIDPTWMKDDLLRSTWYLHMQPPGFNFAVGLVVKLFPRSYEAVLHGVYLLFGAGIAFLLLDCFRQFGVGPRWRMVLTALFIASPGCILYENCLMYDYPVALLLLAAVASLFRFARRPEAIYSIGFFGCLLTLLLVRNIFHLGLICLAAAAGWFYYPNARRAVMLGALPAIALGTGLYLKNWILVGAFTGSTWLGMQLGVTTTYQLNEAESQQLIAKGLLSPIARITPFSSLDQYQPYLNPVPKRGIPVLDAPMAADHPNFNNLSYLQIHRQYAKAALAVWMHAPAAWLRGLAIAGFTYFLPPSNVHSFDHARAQMGVLDRICAAVIFGQFRQVDSRKELREMYARGDRVKLALYTGVFAILVIPVVTLWGAAQLLIPKFRRQWAPDELAALGFLVFIVLMITVSVNLLSSFENNRYRFPIDSFYLILVVLLAKRGAAGLEARSSFCSS